MKINIPSVLIIVCTIVFFISGQFSGDNLLVKQAIVGYLIAFLILPLQYINHLRCQSVAKGDFLSIKYKTVEQGEIHSKLTFVIGGLFLLLNFFTTDVILLTAGFMLVMLSCCADLKKYLDKTMSADVKPTTKVDDTAQQ
jgi:VIT1/CCC1 family predicted Fe2+/Mn2+ transporter